MIAIQPLMPTAATPLLAQAVSASGLSPFSRTVRLVAINHSQDIPFKRRLPHGGSAWRVLDRLIEIGQAGSGVRLAKALQKEAGERLAPEDREKVQAIFLQMKAEAERREAATEVASEAILYIRALAHEFYVENQDRLWSKLTASQRATADRRMRQALSSVSPQLSFVGSPDWRYIGKLETLEDRYPGARIISPRSDEVVPIPKVVAALAETLAEKSPRMRVMTHTIVVDASLKDYADKLLSGFALHRSKSSHSVNTHIESIEPRLIVAKDLEIGHVFVSRKPSEASLQVFSYDPGLFVVISISRTVEQEMEQGALPGIVYDRLHAIARPLRRDGRWDHQREIRDFSHGEFWLLGKMAVDPSL